MDLFRSKPPVHVPRQGRETFRIIGSAGHSKPLQEPPRFLTAEAVEPQPIPPDPKNAAANEMTNCRFSNQRGGEKLHRHLLIIWGVPKIHRTDPQGPSICRSCDCRSIDNAADFGSYPFESDRVALGDQVHSSIGQS